MAVVRVLPLCFRAGLALILPSISALAQSAGGRSIGGGGAKTATSAEATAEKLAAEAKTAEEAQRKKTIDSLMRFLRIAERAGDLPGAIEATLTLRKIAPENERHLSRLLSLYAKAGRMEDRIDVYRELLELKPRNPTYTVGLGTALYRLNRKKQAYALWDGLLVGDKTPADTFRRVGNAYAAEKLYEQAIQVYTLGLSRFEDDYRLLYGKAQALELLGRNQEAIEAYETVRRHAAGNTMQIEAKLGRLYVLSGKQDAWIERRKEEAAAALEKLAECTMRLGERLAANGEVEEARSSYEKALSLTLSPNLRAEIRRLTAELEKKGGQP